MNIRFLGTGAADWNWKQPLDAENRGSTSTLLDGKILIDAGTTGWENIVRFNINPAEITDIFITHSHSDHFNVDNILRIADAEGRKSELCVYTSKQAAERFEGKVKTKVLNYLDELTVHDIKFKVVPANHVLPDPFEQAYNFIIETADGKQLFYALDSGWMCSLTRLQFKDRKMDMIIWDATTGTQINNWRFAEHNDLGMIKSMREAMSSLGYIDEKTIHVFNHIARTLWPTSAEERQKAAEQYDGILAEDGMTMEL